MHPGIPVWLRYYVAFWTTSSQQNANNILVSEILSSSIGCLAFPYNSSWYLQDFSAQVFTRFSSFDITISLKPRMPVADSCMLQACLFHLTQFNPIMTNLLKERTFSLTISVALSSRYEGQGDDDKWWWKHHLLWYFRCPNYDVQNHRVALVKCTAIGQDT